MNTRSAAPQLSAGAPGRAPASGSPRSQFGLLHWAEYLLEAAELCTFMIAACVVVSLVEHAGSPLRARLAGPALRRVLVGAAMGLTAIGLIYSSWGKRSGAHMNPAVTLTFLRLGKIGSIDAIMYVLAQFAGSCLGVLISSWLLGPVIADASVNYVVTLPGAAGQAVAFLAELCISALLMSAVLVTSNHPRWSRFTGICAGLLVALYITFEAPLSGMSMNPARSFGSALLARRFDGIWLYFIAPPLGMLLAAELYVRLSARGHHACAKLHHDSRWHCIFCGHSGAAPHEPRAGTFKLET